MQELDREGRLERRPVGRSARSGDREAEQRPNPGAAREHGMADRLGKRRRRVGAGRPCEDLRETKLRPVERRRHAANSEALAPVSGWPVV